MPLWVALLNTIAALASAGFGIAALFRPSILVPSTDTPMQSRFISTMYAGRAIPLGIAVGIAVWLTPSGPATVILLTVALVAQIADAGLGIAHRIPGMIAGAAFAAVCHTAGLLAAL